MTVAAGITLMVAGLGVAFLCGYVACARRLPRTLAAMTQEEWRALAGKVAALKVPGGMPTRPAPTAEPAPARPDADLFPDITRRQLAAEGELEAARLAEARRRVGSTHAAP